MNMQGFFKRQTIPSYGELKRWHFNQWSTFEIINKPPYTPAKYFEKPQTQFALDNTPLWR